MRHLIRLVALVVVVSGAVTVAAAGAQIRSMGLDLREPEPRAPTPPAMVLADGGLQFADSSVQNAAAGGLNVVWPIPRFTDNANGTVTDNLTGLIWLDDAGCSTAVTWDNGMAWAAALHDGCSNCGGTNGDCGLTDGSIAGQWRVPNVRELLSLVHYQLISPCVPDTLGTGQWSEGDPFSGVLNGHYWTSTSHPTYNNARWVFFLIARFGDSSKSLTTRNIWPVRGGQ